MGMVFLLGVTSSCQRICSLPAITEWSFSCSKLDVTPRRATHRRKNRQEPRAAIFERRATQRKTRHHLQWRYNHRFRCHKRVLK